MKTIRWPFTGQQVSFKSTMNLYTDQVRNLVKGTITHSLKLVLNGVSPQIRPLTPDLRCCGPITPTASFRFQQFGARWWVLRFSGELKYSHAVSLVFVPACLIVRHALCPSVCQGGRSCWIESGSSPWQSSTGSYGSLATAGWLHTATRRQGIIKSVLLLHHTHTYTSRHTTRTYKNNGYIQLLDHYYRHGHICPCSNPIWTLQIVIFLYCQ